MKTRTAKAKGRRLQNWTRDKLRALFPSLEDGDIESRPMGQAGTDVILSPAAFNKFPFSVECKNQEAAKTIYKWYEQAAADNKDGEPLVIMKRNNQRVLAVMDADILLSLLAALNDQ